MRICFVDDDSTQLDYLKSITDKWSQNKSISVELSFYHSSEEMLFEHNNSFPYDVIVLDIQMGNMNGIELAKRIRSLDKNVIIAFISGIADYVFDGYEVQATRYLLKPVQEDKVFELFNYVNNQITTKVSYLIISVCGEKKRIKYDDIIYIESMGHYITLHLSNAEYDYKCNISDLNEDLKDTEFVKTHRSYIVNMKYVEKISKNTCTLAGNISVPLSRNSYKLVNDKFITYYKQVVV